MKMILGESEYMTDGPDSLQYSGEECYPPDLPYEARQLRGGDPNNNHIGQPNRNQQQHQHSTGQSSQQAGSQFNSQPTSHLNLVQFVDQFNSNFNCNSLMPTLSNQPQSQNIANNNQQQLFCSNLADQCKETSLPNLIGPNLVNGQIKIKTENAIDLSSSTNAPANLSSGLCNSSTTHLTSLPNLSNLSNSANMSIPLITNQINLNSIHCEKGSQMNQKAMLVQHNSANDSLPNSVPAAHGLPISLASNLPVNFNEFLLNDYPPGQLNLVNAQASNEPAKCQEQSNKINSNNEMSPIDMEDQERIKLERKRMRNRRVFFSTIF